MKRIVFGFFVALLVSAISCASVWAQATAQASGTVRDQTGAVLPGVEVTATQADTGISRTAITNETGFYVLPNLAVGSYRLEAVLPGFRSYLQTGIVLQVGGSPVINIVLQVGQVSESVEVQANAALVETRNVSVGRVIENERILELPLNGRNVQELITLAGGAVQTGFSRSQSLQGIPEISIGGAFRSATSYRLDGALHVNTYDNNSLPLPFPDALQEFQVETGVRSARSGRNAGAEVSSVTKSGTNELHGNAFWFVRNDLLNARNYFATQGSTLKRNQFGGTLGGPIFKNKLFFFGGYQGTTVRQDPADTRSFVPTAAMLAGDFTTFASAACNTRGQITLRAPFVNNRIDPALLSPAALKLAGRLPKTNHPCGEITYGAKSQTDEHQVVSRVDYELNGKQSLFGRIMYDDPDIALPYSFDTSNLLLSNINGYDSWVSAYAVGHTYLISPNTVNALRLGVSTWKADRSNAHFFSAQDLGVKIYTGYEPEQTRVSVTNGFALGVNNGPKEGFTLELTEELGLTRGDHQSTFGANVGHFRNYSVANTRTAGNFSFNGQTTGTGLSDFLIGATSEFQQTPQTNAPVSQWFFGVYGTDVWRVTPRLTMNYGLRWEPYIPQVRRNGAIANFDEARFAAKQQSTVYKNAPFGFIYPGDPGFPRSHCRKDGICMGAGQEANWFDFSPRLGLAWDVSGDGRMSVRAAWGMAYEQVTGGLFVGYISPPWVNRVILTSPQGGFADPWRDYPGGNPFPTPEKVSADAFFAPLGSYYSLNSRNPTTARNQWNLSVQRQFGQDWTVETTYMGSQAAHIWYNRAINEGIYVPGVGNANGDCFWNGKATPFKVRTGAACSTNSNLDQRRRLNLLYPEVGGTTVSFVDQYENGGTQSYHGLMFSLQRRAVRGVNLGTNYTWSHCWGDDNESQSAHGGNPDETVRPNNRDADRGNCVQDRRHILNLTAVVETPQFANPTMRALASRWRLSTIYRRSSGDWLSPDIGEDRALNGVRYQRPNQVLKNVFLDKSGRPNSQYLNPAAFQTPPVGELGNMGPRNIQGLGTWAFDLALSRTFQFGETRRLEFRAEAYNVTNSFRPVDPSNQTRAGTFGKIRESLDPRILQFALKIGF